MKEFTNVDVFCEPKDVSLRSICRAIKQSIWIFLKRIFKSSKNKKDGLGTNVPGRPVGITVILYDTIKLPGFSSQL